MDSNQLNELTAGMPLVYAGNRLTHVSAELAGRFNPGDRLVVLQETGSVLLIASEAHHVATAGVDRAAAAFSRMSTVSDAQITAFYDQFASLLGDDAIWD